MDTECNLCHTSGDQRNPYIGSSNGTNDNIGYGCVGCHGRLEDAGNDELSAGLGAGLRQHHTNSGVTECQDCHWDADPANYTPVGEDVLPPYYGTVDTLADDPCNPIAQANINENWTLGDFEGLDNDGDLLYDTDDPDCAANVPPTADPGGPYIGIAGEPVQFDGSGSSDSDGTIVQYDWDFGDGTTGTGVSPSHVYAAGDVYDVTLTVTDDAGATDIVATLADIEEPANEVLYWDGNGAGDWDDMDPGTGFSRWVDQVGNPLTYYPDSPTVDAVVRVDRVTLPTNRLAGNVTVESGALVVADNITLTVGDDFHVTGNGTYISQVGGPADDGLVVTGTATLDEGSSLDLECTATLGDLSLEQWGDYSSRPILIGSLSSHFTNEPSTAAGENHLGEGVFLTDQGANAQGVTYDAGSVVVDLFQAAPGDADGNRKVEGADILAILQAGLFGDGVSPDAGWTTGDFDSDDKVAGTDILLLLGTGLFGDGTYALPVQELGGKADGQREHNRKTQQRQLEKLLEQL